MKYPYKENGVRNKLRESGDKHDNDFVISSLDYSDYLDYNSTIRNVCFRGYIKTIVSS